MKGTGAYISHYKGPRTQDLTTPKEFFEILHSEYRFTLDGAATQSNALLPKFTSSATPENWAGERVFCNPPWSDIAYFLELAPSAEMAVFLVPARVNAAWFHRARELGADIGYFKGKLKFGNSKWNSPVDCLLLIFRAGAAGKGAPHKP